jgi:hypothetical protein
VGTFAADRLVAALDSDLIHLTRDIDRSTYLFAIGMVVVVGVLMLIFGIVTAPKAPGADDVQEPAANLESV